MGQDSDELSGLNTSKLKYPISLNLPSQYLSPLSTLKANGACNGDEDSNTKGADSDAASGRREEGGTKQGSRHVIVSQMRLWH